MKLTTLLAVSLLGAPALAQDLVHKAPPQTAPVLIRGATIHTVTGGVVEGGIVLFSDGKLTAVGAPTSDALTLPAETRRVDGAGLHVYPGLVSFNSVMGLNEVSSVDMTQDMNEAGSFTPEVATAVAINADSWNIPVTRRNGILTCGVMPTGGRLPGRASVVRMDGWTWKDMALVQDAGIVVNWPYVGPFGDDDGDARRRSAESVEELDAFFDAAEAYLAARAADPSLETDLRLEAMAGAIDGTKKVFLSAQSLPQIESAVGWATERELDYVLVGGRDAALCLDLLERHDVSLALTSVHRLPQRRDLSFAEPYELPGVLEASGVDFCITVPAGSWTNFSLRNLPYEAAAAIPHGLSRETALRAITLAPAEMLGVGDELGSLEVGKRATLIVTDGDLFEVATNLVHAFVDGREIELVDEQTALDAKYRAKYRQLGLIE